MSQLICKNVSKSYRKKEVLHDVSLTIEQGKIYGLIGRNVPRYEQETGSLFRHLQLWRELYT